MLFHPLIKQHAICFMVCLSMARETMSQWRDQWFYSQANLDLNFEHSLYKSLGFCGPPNYNILFL